MARKIYSYIRFSDIRQAKGHSVQRQSDYAAKYAKDHNLTLDESLTLKDEGLSAYHQKHISKGALGAFYRAIEEGMVDPGSVLIVENLDRLSRANPRKALPHFLNIINAGITVVIAKDGKSYSSDSIDQNPYELFENLIEMVRANSESEYKSNRIKDSLEGRLKHWVEHGCGEIVRNGADPFWVTPNEKRTGFVLVEEQANAVREIISLSMKGWGYVKIISHLNGNFRHFNDGEWSARHIALILKNRALIGERYFNVRDTKYVLSNYYPPILTEEEFYRLNDAIKNRATTKAQRSIPSLLTGNRISFCGHCGCRLVSQNYKPGSYKGKPYQQTDGLRRVRCQSRNLGTSCPSMGGNRTTKTASISAFPLERAIIEYCSDQMELSAILNDDTDQSLVIKAKITDLQRQAREAETVVNNGNEAMTRLLMQGDDVSAINNLVKQHQTKLDELQTKIQKLEDELRFQKVHKSSDMIDQWQQVKKDIYNLDEEARLLIRQIVKKTFKRITVYFHSFNKSDTGKLLQLPIDDQSIVMMLTFINDKARILVIDRKSGDWVKGGDIAISREGVLSDLVDHQKAHV